MTKLYYTISEVAKTIGVNQSLLRFWAKEFSSFVKTSKNDKGIQFYDNNDVGIIKQIYFFIETQGLTLSDAKLKLHDM